MEDPSILITHHHKPLRAHLLTVLSEHGTRILKATCTGEKAMAQSEKPRLALLTPTLWASEYKWAATSFRIQIGDVGALLILSTSDSESLTPREVVTQTRGDIEQTNQDSLEGSTESRNSPNVEFRRYELSRKVDACSFTRWIESARTVSAHSSPRRELEMVNFSVTAFNQSALTRANRAAAMHMWSPIDTRDKGNAR